MLYEREMDEYYKVGTAVLQNGPRTVEVNDAASAAAAAAVVTAVVRTRAHFDETAVVGIYCLKDWSHPHAIFQHGSPNDFEPGY